MANRNRRPRAHAALALWLVAFLAAPTAVRAAPAGEQVVNGQVAFHRDGSVTVINASDGAIIHYASFDILANELVQFVQPHSGARVLNRVFGDATTIDGALVANGIVYILNPAGVFFGGEAVVDVGGLVAAAGNMSDEDFLSGIDRFELAGPVVNEGVIHAQAVTLLGRSVANHGSISAPDGTIALVAGERVLLATLGSRVLVEVDGPAADPGHAGVVQAGDVDAGDGQVVFASGDHYSLAINHSGITRGRDVRFSGGADGTVGVAGTVDVSSDVAGQTGGSIHISGDRIALEGATLDASGEAGGGEILVGGDVRGQGDLPHATRTYVDAESVLRADTTGSGAGGTIVVWASEVTGFFGRIFARGGGEGGDGGFAEISAPSLVSRGEVDLSAPDGDAGTLLYDPQDIEIVGGVADGSDDLDAQDDALETDGGLAGQVLFGDVGDGTDPFLIYESEIEGTDADIVLEASNSITVSGSFDNDGGEGLNVVRLMDGNSLALRTRNAAGDEVGSGELPGIDLTDGGNNEDLAFATTGGGSIVISTGTAEDVAGATARIAVGNLSTVGGFVGLDSFDGDIDFGTISTTGSFDGNVSLVAGGRVASTEAAGPQIVTRRNVTIDGTDVGALDGGGMLTQPLVIGATGTPIGTATLSLATDGALDVVRRADAGDEIVQVTGAAGVSTVQRIDTIASGSRVVLGVVDGTVAAGAVTAGNNVSVRAEQDLTLVQDFMTPGQTFTGEAGANLSAGNVVTGGAAFTLRSVAGDVTTGAIDTSGASDAAGGGTITIETGFDAGAGGSITTGNLDTSGAAGNDDGGSGGSVLLTARGPVSTVTVGGTIDTRGGNGVNDDGGDGGRVQIFTDEGSVTVGGAIDTSGGNGNPQPAQIPFLDAFFHQGGNANVVTIVADQDTDGAGDVLLGGPVTAAGGVAGNQDGQDGQMQLRATGRLAGSGGAGPHLSTGAGLTLAGNEIDGGAPGTPLVIDTRGTEATFLSVGSTGSAGIVLSGPSGSDSLTIVDGGTERQIALDTTGNRTIMNVNVDEGSIAAGAVRAGNGLTIVADADPTDPNSVVGDLVLGTAGNPAAAVTMVADAEGVTAPLTLSTAGDLLSDGAGPVVTSAGEVILRGSTIGAVGGGAFEIGGPDGSQAALGVETRTAADVLVTGSVFSAMEIGTVGPATTARVQQVGPGGTDVVEIADGGGVALVTGDTRAGNVDVAVGVDAGGSTGANLVAGAVDAGGDFGVTARGEIALGTAGDARAAVTLHDDGSAAPGAPTTPGLLFLFAVEEQITSVADAGVAVIDTRGNAQAAGNVFYQSAAVGSAAAPILTTGGGGLAVSTLGDVFASNIDASELVIRAVDLGNAASPGISTVGGDVMISNVGAVRVEGAGFVVGDAMAGTGGNLTIDASEIVFDSPGNPAEPDRVFSTDGTQTYRAPVTLLQDAALEAASVVFESTVDSHASAAGDAALTLLRLRDRANPGTLLPADPVFLADVGTNRALRTLAIDGDLVLTQDTTFTTSGLFEVTGAVDAMAVDASTLTINGGDVQFGGNVGDTARPGTLTVNSSGVVAFTGSGAQQVTAGAGGIHFNPGGRPVPPPIAGVAKAAGDLTLTTPGSLVFGVNEKLTVVGNLVLAGAAVTIGDLSALGIDVQSNNISAHARQPGQVLLPSGVPGIDQGPDILANQVRFQSAPVVIGSGASPRIATATGVAENPGGLNVTKLPSLLSSSLLLEGGVVLDAAIPTSSPGNETPLLGNQVDWPLAPRPGAEPVSPAEPASAGDVLAWIRCADVAGAVASSCAGDAPAVAPGSALDTPRAAEVATRYRALTGDASRDARDALASTAASGAEGRRLAADAPLPVQRYLHGLATLLLQTRMLGLPEAQYLEIRETVLSEVTASTGGLSVESLRQAVEAQRLPI